MVKILLLIPGEQKEPGDEEEKNDDIHPQNSLYHHPGGSFVVNGITNNMISIRFIINAIALPCSMYIIKTKKIKS